MITALKFWNEPNNVSHWDSTLDPRVEGLQPDGEAGHASACASWPLNSP